MARRSFYIKESELDDYQIKFLTKTTKSTIIKTCDLLSTVVLALWKVKEIQNKNSSFYFLVPTLLLNKLIHAKVEELGLFTSNFRTINTYKSFDEKEQRVDNIFIFSPFNCLTIADLELIQLRSKRQLICMVDLQLYKDKCYLSVDQTAVLTKYPTEQLMFNHRLPKKIARFAEYIEPSGDDLEERCKIEGVEKPKVLKYRNLEEQLDQIIEIVKSRGYDDVGILFPKNDQVQHANDYFNSKNFQVEAKYSDFNNITFTNGTVKIITYTDSVGLDFEAVFLPDCEEELVFNQNALYVAITRAYQDLFIMYSCRLISLIETVPKYLYDDYLLIMSEN